MALLFTRLAHNYVKAGYFPTDEVTLGRIITALYPQDEAGTIRLLDPCCGTGAALADIGQGLLDAQERTGGQSFFETFGVEFDRERAWEAKRLLHRVLHADVHDTVIKPRSVSLLFLNPPYGFGVSDAGNPDRNNLDAKEKAERLERTFLKRLAPTLMPGGVLIYIVPHYALDEEIRTYLARHFRNVQCFMAPEKQFQQCVVFGTKVRPGHPERETLALLTQMQAGALMDRELPVQWSGMPYTVPNVSEPEMDFRAVRIDAEQLQEELQRFDSSLLWSQFNQHFNQSKATHRRPLRDLSRWHLALALAAGQVTGMVRSKEGRALLIKGDTFKRKDRSVSTETDEKGKVTQTITLIDRFVPVITAIEFTPGPDLGRIVRIS